MPKNPIRPNNESAEHFARRLYDETRYLAQRVVHAANNDELKFMSPLDMTNLITNTYTSHELLRTYHIGIDPLDIFATAAIQNYPNEYLRYHI